MEVGQKKDVSQTRACVVKLMSHSDKTMPITITWWLGGVGICKKIIIKKFRKDPFIWIAGLLKCGLLIWSKWSWDEFCCLLVSINRRGEGKENIRKNKKKKEKTEKKKDEKHLSMVFIIKGYLSPITLLHKIVTCKLLPTHNQCGSGCNLVGRGVIL